MAVVLALAGCGGGDEGAKRPDAPVRLGEARVATNDERPQGLAGIDRRNGAVQGKPSLDDLDRSSPPPAALGSDQAACTGGGLQATTANLAELGRATLCFLNLERRARGLGGLRPNRRLAAAALVHARDMVQRSYFAHTSRSGATFFDRIKRRGYMARASRWTVGENLAWGTGVMSSPRNTVSAWMQSPPHRANILSRRFREIGIGVAYGAPDRRSDSAAATYNTAFGARRRSG